MLVRCHHDPRDFLELVEPFLLENEPANSLPLSLARSFVDTSTHEGLMLSVESGADVVAVALKSPKRNLMITAAPACATRALAQYLHEYALPVPGVVGPAESARAFCDAWTALTGAICAERMQLRLFESKTVAADALPMSRDSRGRLRLAGLNDGELIETWLHAFIDEATHEGHDHVRARVAMMIGANNVALWEDDDGPASMAAVTRRSSRGAHLAWVYTPPDRRRRGHATACVAGLTQRELTAGRSFCTLYADVANETSAHVYERVGYAPICDAIDATFH